MFYKELLNMRLKLAIWALCYGLIIWGFKNVMDFVRIGGYSESTSGSNPAFEGAQIICFLLTLILPILGGADLIAGETEKGTISFLLSRPISRTQIYTGKLLLNWAGWATIYLTISLILSVMLGATLTNWLTVGAILAMGTAIMFLSATVSIFTHSAVQAIMITVGIILATTFTVGIATSLISLPDMRLAVLGGLGVVSAGLLTAGQMLFTRKEF